MLPGAPTSPGNPPRANSPRGGPLEGIWQDPELVNRFLIQRIQQLEQSIERLTRISRQGTCTCPECTSQEPSAPAAPTAHQWDSAHLASDSRHKLSKLKVLDGPKFSGKSSRYDTWGE
jgi:hypothetical protein